MQLCLMIEGQEGVTWEQWVALAHTCEAAGIPALLRSDHYMNLDGEHPERGSLDAWATLRAPPEPPMMSGGWGRCTGLGCASSSTVV